MSEDIAVEHPLCMTPFEAINAVISSVGGTTKIFLNFFVFSFQ